MPGYTSTPLYASDQTAAVSHSPLRLHDVHQHIHSRAASLTVAIEEKALAVVAPSSLPTARLQFHTTLGTICVVIAVCSDVLPAAMEIFSSQTQSAVPLTPECCWFGFPPVAPDCLSMRLQLRFVDDVRPSLLLTAQLSPVVEQCPSCLCSE